MADLESSIRTFALQDSDISTAFETRFYIDRVPDEPPYPFAKLSQVDNAQGHTQDGHGPRTTLFQIDVYDDDKTDCNTNAEYIRARFDSHRGLMGEIVVGRCWARDVRGEWAPDGRHFRRIIELEIGSNG